MFVLKIQIRKGYVVITAYVAPPVYRRRSADINSYLSLCGEDSFSETQEAIVRSRLVSLCVSILALLIQISRENDWFLSFALLHKTIAIASGVRTAALVKWQLIQQNWDFSGDVRAAGSKWTTCA